MQLLDRVRLTIRRHDLAHPRTRVVAAVSGGSDSVALACLLRELDAAGELVVAGLAHFNHQLRADAGDDEEFCRTLAARLGWPGLLDREDVAARSRRERRSVEDAGRTARHEFFERARSHFAADVVALGHTRDDQAETFLLRLVRGAGARGLSAMHPRNGHIVRPLLGCRRSELRAWLERERIPFRHDSSNDDVSIPRNRVRAELLPLLERRFNPSVVDALADSAEIAREEWRWMAEETDRLMARLCNQEGSRWRIDAASLGAIPEALARLLVLRVMSEAARGQPVSFAHVEEALWLSREGGGPIDGPGQRLQRVGPDLVLTSRGDGARPGDGANLFRYPLSIPGEVGPEDGSWRVSAETHPQARGLQGEDLTFSGREGTLPAMAAGAVAMVQLGRCAPPLTVRSRRPGDWFRPLGLGGKKKLQDFFVDRKVARELRDSVPLVVDATDRIVWVAGHTIDDDFRVTDPAQPVLTLRLKLVGGST